MLDVVKNNDYDEKLHSGISKEFYDKIKANPEEFLADRDRLRAAALEDGTVEGSEMNEMVRKWGFNPMNFYSKRVIPQSEIDAENAAKEKAIKDRQDLIARKQEALGDRRRPLEGLEENWDVNDLGNWGYIDENGEFLHGNRYQWHKGLGPTGIFYKGKQLERNKNPFSETDNKTAYDWYEYENAALNDRLDKIFQDGSVNDADGEWSKNKTFLRSLGIDEKNMDWANISASINNLNGGQLYMSKDQSNPGQFKYNFYDAINKTFKPATFEVKNGQAFIDGKNYGVYNRVDKGGYNRFVPNEINDDVANNTGPTKGEINLGRNGVKKGEYIDANTFRAEDGTVYKKRPSVGGKDTWMIQRAKHGAKINMNKIKKFQMGGRTDFANQADIDAATLANKRENARTANTGEVWHAATDNGGIELSKLDKWKLGTLATELAGLTASVTGLGSGVAGTLGVGATLSNLGTDIADEKVSGWQAAKNAALGLGLDALTFLPGFGVGAKAAKIGKLAKGASRALGAYFAAKGMGAGMDALKKLNSDEKMTLDDYRMLLAGVQGVLGAGHLAAQRGAQKKGAVKEATLDVNGKTMRFENADKAQAYVKKQKDFAKKYNEVKNMDKSDANYGQKVRELATERAALAKKYGKENISPDAKIDTKFGLGFGVQSPLGKNEAGKLRPRNPFSSKEKVANIKEVRENGFAKKGEADNNMIQEASARWMNWFGTPPKWASKSIQGQQQAATTKPAAAATANNTTTNSVSGTPVATPTSTTTSSTSSAAPSAAPASGATPSATPGTPTPTPATTPTANPAPATKPTTTSVNGASSLASRKLLNKSKANNLKIIEEAKKARTVANAANASTTAANQKALTQAAAEANKPKALPASPSNKPKALPASNKAKELPAHNKKTPKPKVNNTSHGNIPAEAGNKKASTKKFEGDTRERRDAQINLPKRQNKEVVHSILNKYNFSGSNKAKSKTSAIKDVNNSKEMSAATKKKVIDYINKLQKGGVLKMQNGSEVYNPNKKSGITANDILGGINKGLNSALGDPEKLRFATSLIGNKKQADLVKKTPKPTLSAPINLQQQSGYGISSIMPQVNNINANVNSVQPQYTDAKLNAAVNLGMNANANTAISQLYNNLGEVNRGIDASNTELANKQTMMNAEIANTNAAKMDAYRDMLHKNKQTRLASDINSINNYLLGKSQEKAQAKRYNDQFALQELGMANEAAYNDELKRLMQPYEQAAASAGKSLDEFYLGADATTRANIDEARKTALNNYKKASLEGQKKILGNFRIFASGGKMTLDEKKQLAAYNAEMKANQKLADDYNKFSREHIKDQQKMLNFMLGQFNATQARILKKK
jgi:hypothetical protein